MANANKKDRPLFLVTIATRPCYIKLASLVVAMEARQVPFLIVESGQHYDHQLTSAKHELGFNHLIGVSLNVQGSLATLAAQLYERVPVLFDLLSSLNPKYAPIPIVSGDTLTAGVLPQAWYLHAGVRSVHIEAGLRTFGPRELEDCTDFRQPELQRAMRWTLRRDDPFPESLCSRLASDASSVFFAPVERNRQNLLREGHDGSQIFVVGSLSADAVGLPTADITGIRPTEARPHESIRVDLHRRENMTRSRIDAVLGGLVLLNRQGLRTTLVLSNALRGALDRFEFWPKVDRVREVGGIVEEPWGSYRSVIEFLRSENCLAIYTDSGGLQEEACILGSRCFTCRFGTDRPETVLDFTTNLLIPPISAEAVSLGITGALSRDVIKRATLPAPAPPYGTNVGHKIAQILEKLPSHEAMPGAFATHRR